MKNIFSSPLINFFVVLLLIAAAAAGGYYWAQQSSGTETADILNKEIKIEIEVDERSRETAFISEVYQLIKNNYWEQLSDEQLSNLFFQAISRLYGSQPELEEKNVDGITNLVLQVVADFPEKNHVDLLAQVVDMVVQNLQPAGRSRLYSEEEKQDLNQRVANVDPETDLFETLNAEEGASTEEIALAYEEKKQEIEETVADIEQKQEKLIQVERAYQALGKEEERERYAQTGVEPTISGEALTDQIYYVKIKQFSPTTVEDLALLMDDVPTSGQSGALIVDLRGNVGGAIDGLPYFLGPFIGNNQYAYQFFSQGETMDFKTKTDFLPQIKNFKRIVVLIDGESQSSAEVMAATLKKYNVGVLLGDTTRGWGTVERIFPIEHQLSDEKIFSLFMVHSLTLNDQGQPIEGTGVAPHISVDQANWQQQLLGYFADQALVYEIAKLYKS